MNSFNLKTQFQKFSVQIVRFRKSKKQRLKTLLIFLVSSITLSISFQNCSKVDFTPASNNIATLAYSGKFLDAVNVSTKKNQSVTFVAGKLAGAYVGALSFAPSSVLLNLKSANGNFQILDPTAGTVTYTPNESYMGPDIAPMYAVDPYGNSISGQINVMVGNNLNTIQPALAVRGMSCVTCHSKVSSNIIVDYGFGNTWFFDASSNDSFYLDRAGGDQGVATLSLLNNSKIIVPAAPVPASALSRFNFTTAVSSLSDFIKARFAQGNINSSAQVVEVPSLKINIPTKARILAAFNNPSSNQVYIPDNQASPALSGITYDSVNQVFKISNLVCDGDLYLGLPVVFADATVHSDVGCRIYSTGNIFITTPIVSVPYTTGGTTYNTQILSTQSIWLGTGRLIKNNAFCETSGGSPTGWYYSNNRACGDNPSANVDTTNCDTLTMRNYQMLIRNTFSRAYPDEASLTALMGNPVSHNPNGQVLIERGQVEASLGASLYDAACSAGGRATDVNRLMLVAPYVNNRFTGEFSGSTIAESALMALGDFTYVFDPVFAKVSILPMLANGELLSGDGF